MKNYTKEDVLNLVRDEDVEFIRLQFTNLHGVLKNVAITSSQLEKVLDNGCLFDVSAIDGVRRVTGSERVLVPDFSTFEIFPWRPQQGKVARLLCEVYVPEGKPSEVDPRYILRRTLKAAAEMGYTFEVGPECEFFLFETDENTNPTVITHEQAGYFDVGPLDEGENARRDIVMNLEDMGFEIEASHHEAAPAQHEIDLAYGEALDVADSIITFKLAVRTLAKRHGLHATFMPKPRDDINGSGMHINMSLKKNGVNIFSDPDDENGLSKEAYWFIGGLMKHLPAMAPITNPLVNSYKRLIPGYEAPVYVAWSAKNRNQMIRIPARMTGNSTRIELRSPDSSANPYLTIALCLAAGLDGINKKIETPKAVDADINAMTAEERKALGIKKLPGTLVEALEEFKNDPFIKESLGEPAYEKYLIIKEKEWNDYNTHVSAWELKEYLNRY
uniref:Glutamine synthetase n=1 Tax=uncultured bacterium fosmid pJB23D10 TaxID=1478061 RepID=A0A0H3U9J2_9BACT|nr:putative glutamine synthetase [uncultured bacterium fosmid pJB23D10]